MEFLRGRPKWVDGGVLVMGRRCGDFDGSVIHEEVWLEVLLQIQ